jgi:uncharacterized protein (DUF1499 family)
MTSSTVLLRRGTGGLLPATPVDFDRLALPASPNTCLVGPPDYAGPKHLTQPPFPVPPERLQAALDRVAAGFPRTWKLTEWAETEGRPIQPSAPGGASAIGRQPEERPIQPSAPGGASAIGRRQAQWVERTRLMNYPDIIAAEIRPAAAGAALLLYSRSLFGWSDLGVNRARMERWLAELTAILKT